MPRLTDRQVQIIGKIGHTERLLFDCSAPEAFVSLRTAELAVVC